MKNVIIVSAHPDDEVLGAGGVMLKHKAQGDLIYWVIITRIPQHLKIGTIDSHERQLEIDQVANDLGVQKTFWLNYDTMTLTDESLIKMIPEISTIFNDVKPEIVYCLNRSDAHSDHRITFEAIAACTKSFRHPYIKIVLMYECISETEFAPALHDRVFIPNYFVDVTEFMDEKVRIMKIYSSEIGEHPFPRSEDNIRALATFRGATAGVKYAEAFQLLKFIDK